MAQTPLLEEVETIIAALRELRSRSLATPADLAEFERRVVNLIGATSDAARGCMPSRLHHWLSDADVRLKDKSMRSTHEAWFAEGLCTLMATYESMAKAATTASTLLATPDRARTEGSAPWSE